MTELTNINLPPNNVEAEKWLISCIFLDNEVLYNIDWFAILPEDFYQKEHQMIFEWIKDLWTKRKTIDVITVWDILTKKWNLELVWWIDYLYELSTFMISPTVVSDYSKIVKEKSTLRQILKVCQNTIGEVYSDKEYTEIIDGIEKNIFKLTQINFNDEIVHIKDILEWRYEHYYEISNDKTKLDKDKVFSGFEWLDFYISGFNPWDLVILAARPSMWKTTFALNIAEKIAISQKKTVAIFSLEMGNEQIVDRILSSVSQIPYSKIHKWLLDENDFANIWEAMEKISETNIYIDDKWWGTVPEIKSKLRRLMIERWHIDLVIIDYLQLMSWSNFKSLWNRVQEISEISRWLKELARELELPIMALSQLSRASEQRTDKRPQLSDLRDSGAIEQDADSVLMLYREDYYDKDDEEIRWKAEVLIRKNRNWPTWDVKLEFKKEIMRFFTVEKEKNAF